MQIRGRRIGAAGARRTVIELKPVARAAKSANAREQKLGATARSFAILEHVAGARAPVDVLDIIASLKLPKATAYRLVDWFVSQGYLVARAGAPAADRRAQAHQPRLRRAVILDAQRHAACRAAALVHTLNETCNIGTLLNGEVVYLDRVEAEHWPLRLHYTIGSRVPLHCSAIGKLYLALAAAPRRRRLLQSLDLRRFTEPPSPMARGSTPNSGRSARSRCRSTARNISWA